MTILILLGHENDAKERLSVFARARCQRALEILHTHADLAILPTGGFGRFNPSAVPHGELLARYLRAHGIAPERILAHVASGSTIEDALGARAVLERRGEIEAIVVTSRFHMPRTRFICEQVLGGVTLHFEAAPDDTAPRDLVREKLREDESKLAYARRHWDVLLAAARAGMGRP